MLGVFSACLCYEPLKLSLSGGFGSFVPTDDLISCGALASLLLLAGLFLCSRLLLRRSCCSFRALARALLKSRSGEFDADDHHPLEAPSWALGEG